MCGFMAGRGGVEGGGGKESDEIDGGRWEMYVTQ